MHRVIRSPSVPRNDTNLLECNTSTGNLKKTKGHETRDEDSEQSDARLGCASFFFLLIMNEILYKPYIKW